MQSTSSAPRLDLQQHLFSLRMAFSAALLGCCFMGIVMGMAGYRAQELEHWRLIGAGALFIPGLLFGRHMARREPTH